MVVVIVSCGNNGSCHSGCSGGRRTCRRLATRLVQVVQVVMLLVLVVVVTCGG